MVQLPPVNEALPAAVDICVCTFRRSTIEATLRSIADQDVQESITIRVIVADNDETPSAADVVRAAAAALGLTVAYVHAPARNISIARNACLDAATAPLVAFLDDDEIAAPGWLRALLEGMERTGAAIILGPVRARYGADLPAWIARADLHSTAPAQAPGGGLETGYSCNVLFRRAIVGDMRFDLRLGRTGGEDDMMFSALHREGHRIAFAPDAWVEEPVTAARARLGWLLRRAFRNGQTFARVRTSGGAGRGGLAVRAAIKALYCGAAILLGCWSPTLWRRGAVRGALHVGVIAWLMGRRELTLY